MRKIRRRCGCGYGNITNYGKRFRNGHSSRVRKISEKHKKNMSLVQIGKRIYPSKSIGPVIINRSDHISYVHKSTRKIGKINKV